jgi:hypothetical protein
MSLVVDSRFFCLCLRARNLWPQRAAFANGQHRTLTWETRQVAAKIWLKGKQNDIEASVCCSGVSPEPQPD